MKTHDEIAVSIKDKLTEERKIRDIHARQRKKVALPALCCLAVVALSAVAIWNFGGKVETQPENSGSSTSQSSSVIYADEIGFDCSAEVPAKKEGAVPGVYGVYEHLQPYKNSKEVAKHSDLVIRGRVVESQYIIDDTCSLNTKSIIVVDEVYKGDVKVGDKVTVMESGGLVPNGEYMNAIYMQKYGKEAGNKDDQTILDLRFEGSKVMEKGEKVFLLLSEHKDYYIGTWLWQGKLLYHEEIDAYAPYIPKDEKEYIEAEVYKEDQLGSIVQDSTDQ